MIEAVGKKCRFLEDAITKLALEERVRVLNGRAESLAHAPKQRSAYDFGSARAVGNFDMTAELIVPFLKRGGFFIAQKSISQLSEEEERAHLCLSKLGCALETVVKLDKDALGKERVLIVAQEKRLRQRLCILDPGTRSRLVLCPLFTSSM